ncbi:MAG: gluconokinase [Pseudomonadota bacterium]
MRFVIMGVSGCGKTSVGEALAAHGLLTFVDGDTLHPRSNIDKMSRGIPLGDADRWPWLAAVGQRLAAGPDPIAIGCSALARRYRDVIRAEAMPVHFIHLFAAKAVLAKRVDARRGHFMPPALLDSQFDALEPLAADEDGVTIDIASSLETVIAQASAYVREMTT